MDAETCMILQNNMDNIVQECRTTIHHTDEKRIQNSSYSHIYRNIMPKRDSETQLYLDKNLNIAKIISQLELQVQKTARIYVQENSHNLDAGNL